jgi:hypothetical protein
MYALQNPFTIIFLSHLFGVISKVHYPHRSNNLLNYFGNIYFEMSGDMLYRLIYSH